ncbi:3,4-dihydroxy-2-butanone-4-phosphate synthase [Asticcacaulis excentricus]|uniref:3,4-dihydroxy-2-butanone 4-phosphate synthase n=1 Tax=Asticcacaulis excentricus (strain ATCC 15261 / DSM 4724 / KCTC 12464 / NCIMB 9791 / VKM B-1370 / CB 48) TaxID=573065 RepID=E8RSV5_ASTEC|nr:3,4-dihydroxy-2-butanone-4-phosphate synthase [Asticcacaulis excentricus]ADU14576.1 3,4-dihydroxy-2-butanone 4-phosphate synthase [Asticcacaulis excentricus CB 48]
MTFNRIATDLNPVSSESPISTIEDILEDARNGRPYILVDAEDRENEGDICIPAQMATPDVVNFMARFGRGLICLAITGERARQLRLPPMAAENGARNGTAFTVAIEAKDGITTGISAHDRARTIAVAIDQTKGYDDIVSPGHVFPLVARDGGVLVRTGHTEAVVDISRMAGLYPAGVICEVMNDDGTMARLPDLIKFAQTHGVKIGTIADLIAYRRRTERFVDRVLEKPFESQWGGQFRLFVYRNRLDQSEHIALVKHQPVPNKATLVRMHQLDVAADVLGASDGRAGLVEQAMKALAAYDGPAVMVMLRDLDPKVISNRFSADEAGVPQPRGLRDYGVGAQILLDLGVRDMIALSDSKPKPAALEGYGLQIIDWKPLS